MTTRIRNSTRAKGNRSTLPPMTELAEQLRGGATLDDLARLLDVTAGRLSRRLHDAGWNSDGTPQTRPQSRRQDDLLDLFAATPAGPWAADAACQYVDPELFFAEGKGGIGQATYKNARSVCFGCPVRIECLDWALANDEAHGIWGGTTPIERRRMRRGAA